MHVGIVWGRGVWKIGFISGNCEPYDTITLFMHSIFIIWIPSSGSSDLDSSLRCVLGSFCLLSVRE